MERNVISFDCLRVCYVSKVGSGNLRILRMLRLWLEAVILGILVKSLEWLPILRGWYCESVPLFRRLWELQIRDLATQAGHNQDKSSDKLLVWWPVRKVDRKKPDEPANRFHSGVDMNRLLVHNVMCFKQLYQSIPYAQAQWKLRVLESYDPHPWVSVIPPWTDEITSSFTKS